MSAYASEEFSRIQSEIYHHGYDRGYQQGKLDADKVYKPLIDLLISFGNESICLNISPEWCEEHCRYSCPQHECYMQWLKEQKNEEDN